MSATAGNDNGVQEVNAQMELLMRHSSPIVRGGQAVASPLAERNTSPSPLRMHRPRSNPRNRTPMRFESPLQSYRIREGEEEGQVVEHEARRITIRPMAGSAVGTTVLTARIHEDGSQRRPLVKSRKQGPSHRKIRRWNNDNFVNLAAEINAGNKGGKTAAEVLLKGHADASKYRCIYDPSEHASKAMTKLRNDKYLSEQFVDGDLGVVPPKLSRSEKVEPTGPLTPEIMLNRIDARLRRVVIKACVNSAPASKVVNTLEKFLVRAYQGKKDKTSREDWDEILVEPPTATYRKGTDDEYVTRFLFDAKAPTGGFHRLLLHGLCQFHGLKAMSSTMDIVVHGKPQKARLLSATGRFSGADVRMVDFIMKQHSDGINADL